MKNIYLLLLFLGCWTTVKAQSYTLDSTRRMSPGVRLKHYKTVNPNRKIFVLEVDLNDPTVKLQVVKANDQIGGQGKAVSTLFQENDAWAYHDASGAVNADFFTINSPEKNPVNHLVSDGEVMWNYSSVRSIFGITENNTPFIKPVAQSYSVSANGVSSSFSRVNKDRSTDALVLYNRFFGSSTGTNAYGTEVKIVPVDGISGWKANAPVQCKVLAKETGIGNMAFTAGQAVLSGHGVAQTYLNNNVNVNDIITVTLNVTTGISNIKQVTGVYPKIVNNGTNYAAQGVINEEGPGADTTREPRTGVGYSQDNSKVFMVVVDGRSTASAGMTLSELADFLLFLGCYQGANLDGGGSSALVANGDLKNVPSDGVERLVASALLVYVNTKTLDDFENGVGHFNREPTWSSTTVGVSTSSTTTLANTAHSGYHSLQVKLYDNPAVTTPWKVRLMSGSGSTSNNRSFLHGTLSFWLKTSTASGAGAYVKLWIDDTDGQEISSSLPVINDGNWHKYTWNLDNTNFTSPNTGNGKIDGPLAYLDAIEFGQGNTSTTCTLYIDDLLHDRNSNEGLLTISQALQSESQLAVTAGISIVPNPHNGVFTIELKDALVNRFEVEILNLAGVKVFSGKYQGNSQKINVETLPAGVYLVNVSSDQGIESLKMIITK